MSLRPLVTAKRIENALFFLLGVLVGYDATVTIQEWMAR